jgi:hypothetical protein
MEDNLYPESNLTPRESKAPPARKVQDLKLHLARALLSGNRRVTVFKENRYPELSYNARNDGKWRLTIDGETKVVLRSMIPVYFGAAYGPPPDREKTGVDTDFAIFSAYWRGLPPEEE